MTVDSNNNNGSTSALILDSIEEHGRGGSMGIGHEHTFYFIHVKKVKGEAAVEVENPLYNVSFDRTKGTRLGLKLDVQTATRSLFIKEVLGGLAFSWNTAHGQELKVKPGDRILKVNRVEGDAHALMEECKKREVLEMQLHRGTAVPISAGLTVTVKRNFGNFQMGQEGTVAKVDEDGDAMMKITGIGKQWVCKQDYDKFIFEDSDRYYLKRYSDFKDLYTALKTKIDNAENCPVTVLPEIPAEERFGFRRQLSSLGMSSFMTIRRDGLQKYLDTVLSQVQRLDMEPALVEFFGPHLIPEVGAAKEDILKTRLDQLISKHISLEAQKKNGATGQ